jgi:hypothetical protein
VKQTSTLGAYFTKDNDYSVTKAEVGFTTFLMEHSIPFSVADHATKLFHKIFPDSAIAKKYACSRTKTSKLVEILGTDTNKHICDTLKSSPFSLATDGSTDYDDVKLYPIVVRLFDESCGRVVSVLVSIKECNKSSTGENIFNLMKEEIEKNDIPWSNLVSFATDNASVMVGRHKGVAAFLLKKSPAIYINGN